MRLIDGILYEGKPSDSFTLRVLELAPGRTEATIARGLEWQELRAATPEELEMWAREADEVTDEERKRLNAERAARRAKTRVRRLIKAAGFDSLLTLTFRANVTDLALAKRLFKEFVRRLKRTIPGFCFCAAWERQKRGAWHCHIATHKVPFALPWKGVKVKSYSVIRAIWRSVTGELGGNIDESKRRKWCRRSCSKLAAYLSKYLTKAFEDGDAWSNRYSSSVSIQVPRAVVLEMRAVQLREVIEAAYEFAFIGGEISTWMDQWGDRFYLSCDTTGPALPPLPP